MPAVLNETPRLSRMVAREAASSNNIHSARRKIGEMALSACAGPKGKEFIESMIRVGVRDLFEAFIGPASNYSEIDAGLRARRFGEAALTSDHFYLLTSNIVQRAMLDGYENVQNLVGDKLVTTMPSTQKVETFSGVTALDDEEDVNEGEDYPDSSFEEKGVESVPAKKKGKIVKLTREAILFDQTAMLLRKAAGIGKIMRLAREAQILNAVTETVGTYKPRINGVATVTPAYRTSAGAEWYNRHLTSITNPLVDFTDIISVIQNFAARTDEKNRLIGVSCPYILVPMSLAPTALAALRAFSLEYRNLSTAASTEVGNVQHSPVPLAEFAAMINGAVPMPLVSPRLDAFSTTTWYGGDFKQCIIETEHWPITVTQDDGGSKAFEADIVARFKGSRFSAVSLISDDFLLRCTA